MQFKIQVIVNDEHGDVTTKDIFTMDKSVDRECLVGMSLSESKQLLKRLQEIIVSQQALHYTLAHRHCPHCDKKRRIKDTYDIQYRTLFGIVSLPNTRLYHCQCTEQTTKTFSTLSDWLADRNSPELQYIETKWASLMSYGLTVDLLKDVLPINAGLNAETVRRHLHKAAIRQDAQLKDQPRFISGCQNQWAKLPKPDKPLTVGINGGYVRDCKNRKTNFEVIVAKSFSKTEPPQTTGFCPVTGCQARATTLKIAKRSGYAGESANYVPV